MTRPRDRRPRLPARGRTLLRFRFPIPAALAVAACSGPVSGARLPADPAAGIESALLPTFTVRGEPAPRPTLPERMEELGVPGVSVAVLAGGEIAWARGYGLADVEAARPVTPDTLFQAASISKPVAALAALQLVEEGRLTLDGDVNEVLTGWQVPRSRFTADLPVTLRGLLTHRAGLGVSGFPGYGPDEDVPDAVSVLDGGGNTDPVRSVVPPGVRWQYSGGGYTVMQQLVGELRGAPFAELMRRRVLEPIGMARSTYEQPIPPDRRDEVAVGYRADGTRVPGGWHTYPEQAAAGLWTTPSELARYAREVQRAFAGASTSVLGTALVREMLTADESGWGLGPAISEDGERFRHGGSNRGFRGTFTAAIAGDYGVFVMTNSDAGALLAAEIAITVAEAYGWTGPRPREVVPVPAPREALERLVGAYAAADREDRYEVHLDGERLMLSSERGAGALWPLGGATFFLAAERGSDVRFEEAGGTLELVLGTLRARRIGR